MMTPTFIPRATAIAAVVTYHAAKKGELFRHHRKVFQWSEHSQGQCSICIHMTEVLKMGRKQKPKNIKYVGRSQGQCECFVCWLHITEDTTCPCCYGGHLQDFSTVKKATPLFQKVLGGVQVICQQCTGVVKLDCYKEHAERTVAAAKSPLHALHVRTSSESS